MEGAGIVEAVGAGVADVRVGDRVAYATPPMGAYAEARLIAADRVVPIPDAIDDQIAAAAMLKGMTAQYLLRGCFQVRRGDTILFHAAAGGVGLIACQWARHLGATVIGTVSSAEKAALAAAHGCHHVINYTSENFVERVRAITQGEGVAVVYDSVGKATFLDSLDCLRPRGMLVSFGQSSGVVPPLEVGLLSAKGSLFLTRPTLMHYTSRREELIASAQALMEVIAAGVVKIEVNQTYPLEAAAAAHRDLESRKTTGSTVLLPP
jgi:NADPH2:quinone reductase